VDVLDQQNGRTLRCELLDERNDGLVQSLACVQRMELAGDVETEGKAENLAPLERPKDRIRSIAVTKPQVLTQHLAEWPVRDPVPIRETSARTSDGCRLLVGEDFPPLSYQPRLPDSRLTHDSDEVRLRVSGCSPIGRQEQVELALTTHEDSAEAPDAPRPHQGKSAKDGTTRHSFGLAFRIYVPTVAELECPARRCDGALSAEHFAWLGRLLEASSDVHGIAGDEGTALARGTDDHFARVQADAHGQISVERVQKASLHRERGMQRPLRVILVRSRGSEDRHHRVSRELLDRAARALDLLRHRVVEAFEPYANALGILIPGERRRADEVGEENRDELALLPDSHA